MPDGLPDFFLLGPPKTASTSLNYYLQQHPDIFMSPIKETRFFDLHYEEGMEKYHTFYKEIGNEKAVGDATPTYAFLPFVAERIYNYKPTAKLIFSFRDPVERAFSGWVMRYSKGSETLSFKDALQANATQNINFEGEAGAAIWLKDQQAVNQKNKLTLRTYIEGSLYAKQLESYLRYFNKEQVKIVFLEDLKKDFQGTMAGIFEFIGVDKNFTDIKNEVINKHRKNRLKPLFNLFGKERVKRVKTLLPKSLQNSFNNIIRTEEKKPELDLGDRSFAYEFFKDDISALEELLHKDLSHWRLKA